METAESILKTVKAFLGKDDPEGAKVFIQVGRIDLMNKGLRLVSNYICPEFKFINWKD